MQFSFRKPYFWHPPNFAKTLFWHTVALFVFLKMPKKHYKTREKQQKNLDQFLTLETPNLGPVFNSTAYIYIYMPTPSQNGPFFVYFDVHHDKLYYKTQYLLRSTYITRNTIEDCAGNGRWKCATDPKLPSSKDLESLGERRRIHKIIINKIRRGRRKQK